MKQKLKDSEEWDWTGKGRHFYRWSAGVGKSIKRRLNKRFRKEGKQINCKGERDE